MSSNNDVANVLNVWRARNRGKNFPKYSQTSSIKDITCNYCFLSLIRETANVIGQLRSIIQWRFNQPGDYFQLLDFVERKLGYLY